MMSDKEDTTRIYDSIKEYCSTYNIPRENLLDILEDQKVLPMIRGKVETKHAVRDSFTMGTRKTPLPHFKVKRHKSRSHLKRATNDRYLVGDFDVLF